MEIKKLFTDDSAVSPVIGVILMVAITVILAAVIAAFVLGLGGSDEVSPQTSFGYDYDSANGELTITVQSGDSFDADRVEFTGVANNNATGADGFAVQGTAWGGADRVTAGAQTTLISDGTDPLNDHFDLNIVWTSSDGDDSSIIGSRSGPNA